MLQLMSAPAAAAGQGRWVRRAPSLPLLQPCCGAADQYDREIWSYTAAPKGGRPRFPSPRCRPLCSTRCVPCAVDPFCDHISMPHLHICVSTLCTVNDRPSKCRPESTLLSE